MNANLLIFIWFGVSVLLLLGENLLLLSSLHRKGVKTVFLLRGTPGYVDMVYARWCKENNKSWAPVIILRIVLIANAIISAVYFKNLVAR